jgi:hypothetical protein
MSTRRSFIAQILSWTLPGMISSRAAAVPQTSPTPRPAAPPPAPTGLPPEPPESLDGVIAKVRQMNAGGESHAGIAEYLSTAIDKRIAAPNKFSENLFMTSEQKDAWSRLSNAQMTYDEVAKEAWKGRVGQCGEHAVVAYYVLKQAGVGGNPRILSIGGSSTHEFVVWDMTPGANSTDPRTWGDKAVVVDGWLGKSMNKDQAWTDEYISDQGGRRMVDKTAARPGVDGWDTEAPLWTVDEQNKDSLTRIPGAKSGCFIATAAYGTAMAPQLSVLRCWRDTVLMKSAAGRAFVAVYCRVSPPAARLVARHARLRAAVRIMLRPAVRRIAAAQRRAGD